MVASQQKAIQVGERVDPNVDNLNDFGTVLDPKQNEGLVATFYEHAERNNFRSEQEKRPAFDKKVFLRIERVGDKLSVNEREATEFDKARFASEYQAFLNGDNQLQGIPIETLPGLDVARVAELKAVKCHTIQALASVPDSALKYIGMDGIALREKARQFIAATEDAAGERAIGEVKEQQEQGNARLDTLEKDVEGMKDTLGGIGDMLQQVLKNQAAAVNNPEPQPAPDGAPDSAPDEGVA